MFNRPSSFQENTIPRNLVHQADISERNTLLIKLRIAKSLCEGSCLIIQQIPFLVAPVVEVIIATIY